MRIVDEITHMVRANTTVALEKATAAVTTTITQLEDDRQALALALDEAAEVGLTTELQHRIRQLRQNIADLEAILVRQQKKVADAEAAENERLHEKEIAAAKEAAKTRKRAAAQHVSEYARNLKLIPDALSRLHKAIEEGHQAGQRAAQIMGEDAFSEASTARLLGRAVQQAALEPWLRTALAAVDRE
jgi:hypothetical protein